MPLWSSLCEYESCCARWPSSRLILGGHGWLLHWRICPTLVNCCDYPCATTNDGGDESLQLWVWTYSIKPLSQTRRQRLNMLIPCNQLEILAFWFLVDYYSEKCSLSKKHSLYETFYSMWDSRTIYVCLSWCDVFCSSLNRMGQDENTHTNTHTQSSSHSPSEWLSNISRALSLSMSVCCSHSIALPLY